MPTIPLPVSQVIAAVREYHNALDQGFLPKNAVTPGAVVRPATHIAAGVLGLSVAGATTKMMLRLDTAIILGIPVRHWSLEKRWSDAQRGSLLSRYESYHPNFRAEIENFIKVDSSPAQETVAQASLGQSAPANFEAQVPFVSEVVADAPAAESRDVLEARRDRDAIANLKAGLKRMEGRALAAEDKLAVMESLHKARVEPAEWIASPHVQAALSLTPLLFTSDYQCGEVVHGDEIEGINEYNSDIFCERYQKMVDKTISLARENTGATEFPGLLYLRGGDAISGEIHDELAETNDLSAIPAGRLVFQQEREGIMRLRSEFGRVRVISLPGNHGRTTFKSHAKHMALHNFETMISWWLADSFSSDPNVTFWTPHSADALFEVEGWKGLLSHGDKMGSRGGQGFIGPAATIARGHQKLFQNWTATGQRVDFILTGHLHTSLKLERGFANGALVGYNEYARDLRCLPDAAKQWLLFMHREQMVSHQFELQLSPKPRRFVTDTTETE